MLMMTLETVRAVALVGLVIAVGMLTLMVLPEVSQDAH